MLTILPPPNTQQNKKPTITKAHMKTFGVMDISINLVMVMVSWFFIYVQTLKIVYIKYAQIFAYQIIPQ